jgi:hypothetical protein
MTTIITRLYSDTATAQSVAAALMAEGHDQDYVDVIGKDGEGDVMGRLRHARVSAVAGKAYAPAIAKGNTLVVVRAPFTPMGAARNAMKVVDRTKSIKVGIASEDEYIREEPRIAARGRVLPPGTFFMSNPHRSSTHGHILGSNPIIHSKPRTSAISGGAYMSRFFWPMKLVSRPKEGTSAIRGGWLVSSMFGIPTLIGK